jgi:hypothetical protein
METVFRYPVRHPYYNSVNFRLECALESLTQAMEVLPRDSMAWAMCFDSANDMRQLLGLPVEKFVEERA